MTYTVFNSNRILVLFALFIALISCQVERAPAGDAIDSTATDTTVFVEINQKPMIIDEPDVTSDSLPAVKQRTWSDPSFVEGIYLNAYTVFNSRFDTILAAAEEAGINAVVFDVKNMEGKIFTPLPDDRYFLPYKYVSDINIRGVVKKLHDHGMYAIARVVMFHDQNLARRDSTLRPQREPGVPWTENNRNGPSWLDSSNPYVQRSLFNFIDVVALQGVDEIQMDYIRFPTQGRADSALFAFQIEDMEKLQQDSTYVMREKEDVIEDVVSNCRKVCERHGVKLSADVFAIVAWQGSVDIANTGQRFTRMTKHLNKIHPMLYSSHFYSGFNFRKNVENEPYQIMFQGTEKAVAFSDRSCRVIPYIQANAWKVNYTPEYVRSQIVGARDAGADGYMLWHASNHYYTTLAWIKDFRKQHPEMFEKKKLDLPAKSQVSRETVVEEAVEPADSLQKNDQTSEEI